MKLGRRRGDLDNLHDRTAPKKGVSTNTARCRREPRNPYFRYLYHVDVDGSHLMLLSPEPADHLITSPWNDVLQFDGAVGYDVISPSGKYAVYNVSPIAQPSSTVICNTASGRQIATFERADASRLFAAGYHAPEEFVAQAATA